MEDTCQFCKSKRKNWIMYKCGSLDNDPFPRTYRCAIEAYFLLKEKLSEELQNKFHQSYDTY